MALLVTFIVQNRDKRHFPNPGFNTKIISAFEIRLFPVGCAFASALN